MQKLSKSAMPAEVPEGGKDAGGSANSRMDAVPGEGNGAVWCAGGTIRWKNGGWWSAKPVLHNEFQSP